MKPNFIFVIPLSFTLASFSFLAVNAQFNIPQIPNTPNIPTPRNIPSPVNIPTPRNIPNPQTIQNNIENRVNNEANQLYNELKEQILAEMVNQLELGLSDTFMSYLGVGKVREVSVNDAESQLRETERKTGLKPALVYAFFKSPNEPDSKQWRYHSNQPNGQTSRRNPKNDDDKLQLVVVTSSDKVIQKQLTTTRKEMITLVQRFRSTVTNIRQPRSYSQPSRQLYQILIKSIESDLQQQGINNLTFIMDDGLRTIPLSALSDGQHFLIEKYSVGMMPSLSLTNIEYHDLRNTEVLAMGADTFTDRKLSPLPGVPVEVHTIVDELWQGEGESLLNQDFTVQKLKTIRSNQSYAIIHLATHGEFLPGEPRNSYIQFWNRKVTFDQLSQLQLNNPPVDLLVLSACRSAIGDNNAELGFAGFAVLAGVNSAIGSLWNVSDQGTLALMTNFYSNLKTVSTKAEALRKAQLDMIQGKVKFENNQLVRGNNVIPLPPNLNRSLNLDMTHPYYWSGFMLVGNPW